MKKLIGLYNFKALKDKGYTTEQISKAVFDDVMKKTNESINNMKIYLGKDLKGKDFYLDLEKENLHTIFLTGTTGSGKSIFHYSMYKQMMEQNTPDDLGFIFMDMTRVDFGGWQSPYLYLPIIYSPEQALNVLEMLANESELRAQHKISSKRAIVIHIEECTMMGVDINRFEQAWLKFEKHKDKNNMYIVFSTSRPSIDIFTKTFRDNTDLKVVFIVSSELDSNTVLGKSLAEKLAPWQKVLAYNNKEIVINAYSDNYIKELKEFWEKMFKSG